MPSSRVLRSLPAALPAVVWALLIAASSSTVIGPKAFVGGASRGLGVPRAGFQSLWDVAWWLPVKGWHAFEFAVLALLLRRAGARPLLALTLTLAWAALDEWHQTFVPARGGRASDVLIDMAGASVALLAEAWIATRKGKPGDKRPRPSEASPRL